jgi:hypothetical protein
MQIDQARIEKAIVEEAVQGFMSDDDLYNRVKSGLEQRIDKLFAEKVADHVAATVEQIAKDGFEREYRKVDGFGKSTGPATTISAELQKLVGDYWQVRVGRDGKPTDNSYNSTSRAEWMMLQVCADDFSAEMKQHIVNVAGALKDHFRGVLQQHIGAMLSDVFKVQSQGDRDAKLRDSSIIHPPAKPIGA